MVYEWVEKEVINNLFYWRVSVRGSRNTHKEAQNAHEKSTGCQTGSVFLSSLQSGSFLATFLPTEAEIECNF